MGKTIYEFDKMVEFLDSTYPAKSQIVPCLIGPVGIGKTAAVYKHAENVGAGKVVTIIASQILPNEVSGITMPVHESKAMEIYDHFRLSNLKDGDILFFDELLEADQLVLSACLTLIESRQMMSGKKLPDIQIVAATNPTISPKMLKDNIRQRFVFRRFSLDKYGCWKFIKDNYGLDVPREVLELIQETGNEYNILTQRSLSKMAYWMSTAKDNEQAEQIADAIDNVWNQRVGTKLYQAWKNAKLKPEEQFKDALRKVLDPYVPELLDHDDLLNTVYHDELFAETTMTELIEMLQNLPNWEQISMELSQIEMKEAEIINKDPGF